MRVEFKRLPHGADLPLPFYASKGAAGLDLSAAISEETVLVIHPGHQALIPCGFSIALEDGFEAQVRPRSGLALKHGVTVTNAPGTIDADYRGEVMVILRNMGTEPFKVERGMRIAQMVVATVVQAEISEVAELTTTERGADGFGSTGVTAPETPSLPSQEPPVTGQTDDTSKEAAA